MRERVEGRGGGRDREGGREGESSQPACILDRGAKAGRVIPAGSASHTSNPCPPFTIPLLSSHPTTCRPFPACRSGPSATAQPSARRPSSRLSYAPYPDSQASAFKCVREIHCPPSLLPSEPNTPQFSQTSPRKPLFPLLPNRPRGLLGQLHISHTLPSPILSFSLPLRSGLSGSQVPEEPEDDNPTATSYAWWAAAGTGSKNGAGSLAALQVRGERWWAAAGTGSKNGAGSLAALQVRGESWRGGGNT